MPLKSHRLPKLLVECMVRIIAVPGIPQVACPLMVYDQNQMVLTYKKIASMGYLRIDKRCWTLVREDSICSLALNGRVQLRMTTAWLQSDHIRYYKLRFRLQSDGFIRTLYHCPTAEEGKQPVVVERTVTEPSHSNL